MASFQLQGHRPAELEPPAYFKSTTPRNKPAAQGGGRAATPRAGGRHQPHTAVESRGLPRKHHGTAFPAVGQAPGYPAGGYPASYLPSEAGAKGGLLFGGGVSAWNADNAAVAPSDDLEALRGLWRFKEPGSENTEELGAGNPPANPNDPVGSKSRPPTRAQGRQGQAQSRKHTGGLPRSDVSHGAGGARARHTPAAHGDEAKKIGSRGTDVQTSPLVAPARHHTRPPSGKATGATTGALWPSFSTPQARVSVTSTGRPSTKRTRAVGVDVTNGGDTPRSGGPRTGGPGNGSDAAVGSILPVMARFLQHIKHWEKAVEAGEHGTPPDLSANDGLGSIKRKNWNKCKVGFFSKRPPTAPEQLASGAASESSYVGLTRRVHEGRTAKDESERFSLVTAAQKAYTQAFQHAFVASSTEGTGASSGKPAGAARAGFPGETETRPTARAPGRAVRSRGGTGVHGQVSNGGLSRGLSNGSGSAGTRLEARGSRLSIASRGSRHSARVAGVNGQRPENSRASRKPTATESGTENAHEHRSGRQHTGGSAQSNGHGRDRKDTLWNVMHLELPKPAPHSQGLPMQHWGFARASTTKLDTILEDLNPYRATAMDFLRRMCILPEWKRKAYRMVFDELLKGHDTRTLSPKHLCYGLQAICGHTLTNTEVDFVAEMLDLSSPYRRRGVNFEEFAMAAALSEHIPALEQHVRDHIDPFELSKKKRKAMLMFFVDAAQDCTLHLEDLESLLDAGRVIEEQKRAIIERLMQHGHSITFIEYLAYLPLFLDLHDDIVTNTFHDEKRLFEGDCNDNTL